MSEVSLSTFPDNSSEALALLYVQSQELAGKSPEDLCEMYWDAYWRIRKCTVDVRKSAKIRHE